MDQTWISYAHSIKIHVSTAVIKVNTGVNDHLELHGLAEVLL